MAEKKSHILVIDDDARLRSLLQRFLRESGFLVSVAQDADSARAMMKEYTFNLLIIDVMMPGESGMEFLRKLREKDSIPAIMLTAMSETRDVIDGLEAGADDYISKPFEPHELILRINNILKRVPAGNELSSQQKLAFGSYFFDLTRKELISQQGKVVHITPIEGQLLSILGESCGRIFSREKLADILGNNQSPRSIDVQITRLRRKIEKDSKNPRYLQTVRGKGYMLLHD